MPHRDEFRDPAVDGAHATVVLGPLLGSAGCSQHGFEQSCTRCGCVDHAVLALIQHPLCLVFTCAEYVGGGMMFDVQPLVKSLFCPIRPSPNGLFDSKASIP